MALRYLKCKGCKREFSSGIDVPPGVKIGRNTHECPHCRHAAEYAPDDYNEKKLN